jgi:uncharacterized membrane protein
MSEIKVEVAKTRSWRPTITSLLKNRLVAGIFVVVPIYVTYIVIKFVFNTMQGATQPLARWVAGVLAKGAPTESLRTILSQYIDWIVPILAVFLTLFILYVLGLLAANVFGRRIIQTVDLIAARIPGVKTIYTSTKQILTTFSGEGFISTQRVVLVEFPHKDMRVVAFMTGQLKDADTNRPLSCVFIPTTPNVTTGYMEIVPRDHVIETNWTVEEAFKMLMSGGIICPASVRFYTPAEREKNNSSEESAELKAQGKETENKSISPGDSETKSI